MIVISHPPRFPVTIVWSSKAVLFLLKGGRKNTSPFEGGLRGMITINGFKIICHPPYNMSPSLVLPHREEEESLIL
jgi:hypothetical protein